MRLRTSWFKLILAPIALATLFACSNGSTDAEPTLVGGKHPANWLSQHFLEYKKDLKLSSFASYTAAKVFAPTSRCASCHGSDGSGGISKVSCLSTDLNGQSCHATKLGHPDGWRTNGLHGLQGAKLPPVNGVQGFSYCQTCHGADYNGGTAQTCINSTSNCHTGATSPHPKPWLGVATSHTYTDPGNAAACSQCHAYGNNFGLVMNSAAKGIEVAPTPGCYNNTVCHGGAVNPTHSSISGDTYKLPAQHGLDAAGKSSKNSTFNTCSPCHANAVNRFNISTNDMPNGGCESCHAAGTAHPTPWLPNRVAAGQMPTAPNTTTHATVSLVNIQSGCVICHGANLTGWNNGVAVPSCSTADFKFGVQCHATTPTAVNQKTCKSCHNGTYTVKSTAGIKITLSNFNDLKQPATGAHQQHLTLPSSNNIACSACHSTGGVDIATQIGNVNHANGYVYVRATDYSSKSVGSTYDANSQTCKNVRCHGGIETPNWNNSVFKDMTAFKVVKNCNRCHSSQTDTNDFNSYYSAIDSNGNNLHDFHLAQTNPITLQPIVCVNCHQMSDATHFNNLVASSPAGSYANLTVKYDPAVPLFGNHSTYHVTTGTGGTSSKTTCSNIQCHQKLDPATKSMLQNTPLSWKK